MWSISFCFIGLVVICITHWIYRWRNPKCDGTLPPGSMGFPLIGETIGFFIPSRSIDIPPFIKKRMQRYGPLFKTNLAGKPVVISTDAEISNFILLQEGKLVELWYLDSFMDLLGQQDSVARGTGYVHKYLKNFIMNHFGPESLKERLLPVVQQLILQNMCLWSSQGSIDVKKATSTMAFDLNAKLMFGYDPTKSMENIGENLVDFVQGLMSLPLNIPGTTFNRCLKNREKVTQIMRQTIKERNASPERQQKDFLDHFIDEMRKEAFVTEDFIIYVTFGLLIASFETISSVLTLSIVLLTEHPLALKELTDEHEAILRDKENVDSAISWKEYKSMTFTLHVINESLRLANVAPGILRRAVKDFQINGYIIPKGWIIMIASSALQLNPHKFDNPLAFNPWRWKENGSNISKDFVAFGGGMRSCAGAEYSKVQMAIFLHILVTKYRWTKVSGGDVTRTPALGFGKGFYIQVSKMKK